MKLRTCAIRADSPKERDRKIELMRKYGWQPALIWDNGKVFGAVLFKP
jgi:hypothetical protein